MFLKHPKCIVLSDVRNLCLQVDKITFLYKVKEGAAGASFGLNVARLAGLPPAVTARASAIASCLTRDGRFQPPPGAQGGSGDAGVGGEFASGDEPAIDLFRQCLKGDLTDNELRRLRDDARALPDVAQATL